MITIEQLKILKKGDIVSYGLFKELKFMECDGINVVLQDKHSNKKSVYACLFLKHGEILTKRRTNMEKKRLRNLTTEILHTDMEYVYTDLEWITGMTGLMTHMLPTVNAAVLPWLKEKVKDPEYWDNKYTPDAEGDYPLEPMNQHERKAMMVRLKKKK